MAIIQLFNFIMTLIFILTNFIGHFKLIITLVFHFNVTLVKVN